MSSLQEVKLLARECGFNRRMPIRAQQLAIAASSLDEADRVRLEIFMASYDIPGRMARRACQAAPSSLVGANRIIAALESLLGRELAIGVLQDEDYDTRLLSCAKRFTHPKKNRLKAAKELCEHLADLFGFDDELRELLRHIELLLKNQRARRLVVVAA